MTGQHQKHHEASSSELVAQAVLRLRTAGERVTDTRRLLLEVLAKDSAHLTADAIADQVRDAGVHRATVFRNLDAFVRVGLVTHHQVPGGATSYHLATGGHLHAHCATCQRVIALDPTVFEVAAELMQQHSGFTFLPDRSSISGICDACLESGIGAQPQANSLA